MLSVAYLDEDLIFTDLLDCLPEVKFFLIYELLKPIMSHKFSKKRTVLSFVTSPVGFRFGVSDQPIQSSEQSKFRSASKVMQNKTNRFSNNVLFKNLFYFAKIEIDTVNTGELYRCASSKGSLIELFS